MTETTGTATINTPERSAPAPSGGRNPGMQVRLADDGEILVRGPLVCSGYLRADGGVEPVADADGWLATGDVGTVDADGFLTITDRKKELIITSSGKNISPAQIEGLLRAHPLIGQAVAIGDRRPYVTALIVLDDEFAPAVGAGARHRRRAAARPGLGPAAARRDPGRRRRRQRQARPARAGQEFPGAAVELDAGVGRADADLKLRRRHHRRPLRREHRRPLLVGGRPPPGGPPCATARAASAVSATPARLSSRTSSATLPEVRLAVHASAETVKLLYVDQRITCSMHWKLAFSTSASSCSGRFLADLGSGANGKSQQTKSPDPRCRAGPGGRGRGAQGLGVVVGQLDRRHRHGHRPVGRLG